MKKICIGDFWFTSVESVGFGKTSRAVSYENFLNSGLMEYGFNYEHFQESFGIFTLKICPNSSQEIRILMCLSKNGKAQRYLMDKLSKEKYELSEIIEICNELNCESSVSFSRRIRNFLDSNMNDFFFSKSEEITKSLEIEVDSIPNALGVIARNGIETFEQNTICVKGGINTYEQNC